MHLMCWLICLWSSLLSLSLQQLKAAEPFPKKIVVKEDLLYEVSFLGIPLGTIRIVTYGTELLNGKPVVRAAAYIDSHPNIPFVELHSIFNGWIDTSLTFSYQFRGSTKLRDSLWSYNYAIFDYDRQRVIIEEGVKDTVWQRMEFQSTKRWNDGFSLFYLARKFITLGRSIAVPTVIEFDTTKTIFYFRNEKKTVEIDAVPYPVRTRYFEGKALWKGIYGLTGEFRGWFSDDDASVPIYAKMKVYLGSVTIELVRWQREDNWMPPKAVP